MRRDKNGAVVYHREQAQERGLHELCRTVKGVRRVVEIGSHMGESAAIFATYFPEVYCVDTWGERELTAIHIDIPGLDIPNEEVEKSFDIRMGLSGGRICKVKKASPKAAANFPDRYFDLVYIDGAHDYDSVLADIRAWRPKTNAYIGGHDYVDEGDVWRAVCDELGHPRWIFEDSSWLWRMA